MLDGIKIATTLSDFRTWEAAVGLSFDTPVTLSTGQIKHHTHAHGTTFTHFADWRGYRLTVRENIPLVSARQPCYYLTIQGSLHKAHQNGQNYDAFDYVQLQEEVHLLCNQLRIPPHEWQVQNLEFGVNIRLHAPPADYIRHHLIAYKRKAFTPYKPDRGGRVLGSHAILSQYEVKAYDKGAQYNLPYHLMRVELSFKRMQQLKACGIATLSDLIKPSVLASLGGMLSDAWLHILLYDILEDPETFPLKPSQRRLLLEGSHPTYWSRLALSAPQKYADRRKAFKALLNRYGQGHHAHIGILITEGWRSLLDAPEIAPRHLDKNIINLSGKGLQTLQNIL